MGVTNKVLVGYGFYFDPGQEGSTQIWTRLAALAGIEIECGEDFNTVPMEHVGLISDVLADNGFYMTLCVNEATPQYMITYEAPKEAEFGSHVRLTDVERKRIEVESWPLREKAALLGFRMADAAWFASIRWN